MNAKKKVMLYRYSSPCGEMLLGSVGERLCLCDWASDLPRSVVASRWRKKAMTEYVYGTSSVIEKTIVQLEEYFAGKRRLFTIPLLLVGTDFQLQVWRELQQIPYGTTCSYAALAERVARPSAVRAVANANGANAISILIPCHRVIGSNHTLTGYAGGLDAKRHLLQLEAESF